MGTGQVRARVRPGHRWETKRNVFAEAGEVVDVAPGELHTCAHALISLDEEQREQEAA